jgi:hypothetical protein
MSLRDAEKYKKKKKKIDVDTESLPVDKGALYINEDFNTPIDNEDNIGFSEKASPDLFLDIEKAQAKDEYASPHNANKDDILINQHKSEIFSDDFNLEYFQQQIDICSEEVSKIKESCTLTQMEVEQIRELTYAQSELLSVIGDKMKLDSL